MEIMESRRLGTRTLSRALASIQDGQRPPLLVSASGVGFYGADNGTFWLDESAPRGTGFLAEVRTPLPFIVVHPSVGRLQ